MQIGSCSWGESTASRSECEFDLRLNQLQNKPRVSRLTGAQRAHNAADTVNPAGKID